MKHTELPDEIAKVITAELYKLYGGERGYLFGLKPQERYIVKAIVKQTLWILCSMDEKFKLRAQEIGNKL